MPCAGCCYSSFAKQPRGVVETGELQAGGERRRSVRRSTSRAHGHGHPLRPNSESSFVEDGRWEGPQDSRERQSLGLHGKAWHGKVPKHIDSAVSCAHVPRDIEKDSYNNSVFGLLFSQDVSILSRKKNKLLKIKFS